MPTSGRHVPQVMQHTTEFVKLLRSQIRIVIAETTSTATSPTLRSQSTLSSYISGLLVDSPTSRVDHVDCRRSPAAAAAAAAAAGTRLIEIDHRISRLHCPATPANPIHRDRRRFLAEIIPVRDRRIQRRLDGWLLIGRAQQQFFIRLFIISVCRCSPIHVQTVKCVSDAQD